MIMGSRGRIRLMHLFQIFISWLLFLKNSKFGVDDRGHCLRSGSPVTIYPRAPPFDRPVHLLKVDREYHF